MTRTDNILRNSKYGIITFVLQKLLQFILRTIVIYILGQQYVGINGLFTNIFSCLNLVELGIGSAIVFSMYKPIAENDTEKVRALNNLYKKIYLVISIIVATLGLALIPFLNYLVKDGYPKDINIYIVYVVYLANIVIGYFGAHKRSLLFAYQRNDVENKVKSFGLIALNVFQILFLLLTKNYYFYIAFMPIFTLLESLIVIKQSKKICPEITGKSQPLDKQTKKEITKNVAAMSMHKLGGVVVLGTDNILISVMFGLSLVGIYNNYYLIVSTLISFIAVLTNSLKGSIGNLIVTADKDIAYSRFNTLQFAFSWLIGWFSVCLICLFQPFMDIWVKDQSAMLSMAIVVSIVVSFYLREMRQVTLLFRDAAGLVWQDRIKPVLESIANLALSILFAKHWGLIGIVLGTIASTILFPLWIEPVVVHKHLFKKSSRSFFLKYIYYALVTVGACFATYFLCSLLPSVGGWNFVIKALMCLIVPNILFLMFFCLMPEFKQILTWIKHILSKIFKNQKVQSNVIGDGGDNNQIEMQSESNLLQKDESKMVNNVDKVKK